MTIDEHSIDLFYSKIYLLTSAIGPLVDFYNLKLNMEIIRTYHSAIYNPICDRKKEYKCLKWCFFVFIKRLEKNNIYELAALVDEFLLPSAAIEVMVISLLLSIRMAVVFHNYIAVAKILTRIFDEYIQQWHWWWWFSRSTYFYKLNSNFKIIRVLVTSRGANTEAPELSRCSCGYGCDYFCFIQIHTPTSKLTSLCGCAVTYGY